MERGWGGINRWSCELGNGEEMWVKGGLGVGNVIITNFVLLGNGLCRIFNEQDYLRKIIREKAGLHASGWVSKAIEGSSLCPWERISLGLDPLLMWTRILDSWLEMQFERILCATVEGSPLYSLFSRLLQLSIPISYPSIQWSHVLPKFLFWSYLLE